MRFLINAMKPADYLLIVVLALTGILWPVLHKGNSAIISGNVMIQVHGEPWFVRPIENDTLLAVPGLLGITTVQIRHGKVRITDSPCTGKTCRHRGFISRPDEWLLCLPNRVLVTIIADTHRKDSPDATTY